MKTKSNFIFLLVFALSLAVWSFGVSESRVQLQSAHAGEDDEEELSEEEKAELEEKEDEIDDELDDLEDDLKKAQQEKEETVQQKLQISSEIGAINSNITVIENELEKTEQEIVLIDASIKQSEEKLGEKREVLAEVLRSVYQLETELQLLLIDNGGDLGEYFEAVDGLGQLEQQLHDAMERVKEEKREFEGRREEKGKAFEVQGDQKKTLETEKNKKSWVLGKTQQELNSQEATIGQIQSKMNKLKLELSALLGEGYDADDIKDAVKYASKKTGVRKDFLMGMLVVESDLGRYTGGCNYKESRMNDYRKKLFKDICKDLDYNYKKQKVSCPPSGYVGTGGAMGVAQFMSDTWMGYQDQIAANTGHNPPDPWNLTDGVMAMALKLARDGATKKSGECKAAMRYLGGSHEWYCDKVQYWADHYKELI